MNDTTVDLSALFTNTTPLLIALIVFAIIAAACGGLAIYCALNRYNDRWYTRDKPRHVICTASIVLILIVVGLLITLLYASFPATSSIINTVEQQTDVTDLSCGAVARGQMRDNTLQCTFVITLLYASFPATSSIINTVEQQTDVTDLSCGAVARGQMRDNTLQCTFGKDGKQYQGILIIHGKTATLYKSAIMEPMPVTTVH